MGEKPWSGEDTDTRARRSKKVKSGCRTCKIRKVKCDERFPVCDRCVSTGRSCDGYGVWGGGGNQYGQRSRQATSVGTIDLGKSRPAVVLNEALDEALRFEWFLHRTVRKLPGIFTLDLWDALLLPASLTQRSVLHAALSLSCLHQNGTRKVECLAGDISSECSSEKNVLQHYIKATHELSRSMKDKQGIRTVLLTCLLFVYLELLRGRFRIAQAHMLAGLNILQEMQRSVKSTTKEHNVIQLSPASSDLADVQITEAFSRLYVQFRLSTGVYCLPMVFKFVSPLVQPAHFDSINDAWFQLERIICEIIFLTDRHYHICLEDCQDHTLRESRAGILRDLSWWESTFKRSNVYHREEARKAIATTILYAYHAMATIMASTCLSNNETIYDGFTELFVKILAFSSSIWIARMPTVLPDNMLNMSRSIVDIGWLPLLYYTAIKCRICRIRLHAIRLLESTSHREGIWDARITAAIARNVMQIEETGSSCGMDEGFALHETPAAQSLGNASLPNHLRVSNLRVTLPDEPDEGVLLRYTLGDIPGECVIALPMF